MLKGNLALLIGLCGLGFLIALVKSGPQLLAPSPVPSAPSSTPAPASAPSSAPAQPSSVSETPLDRALLYKGADINAKFKGNGFTALMVAAQQGDVARANLLLQAGANTQGLDGKKALVLAANANATEIVQALLDRGVNPNVNMAVLDSPEPISGGILLLRQAVRYSKIALVQQLLKAGADPTLREEEGSESILLEVLFSNPYTFFLDWQGKPLSQFPTLKEPRLGLIKALLQAGANPNDRDRSNGTSVLMLAAAQEQPELVNLLIQRGANVNAVNAYGDTPLVYAAWRGSPAVVKILLDNKANGNAVSHSYGTGRTPLMFAVKRGSFEVVKLLVDHKANVNAVSLERKVDRVLKSERKSVLDHALETNQAEIIQFLIQQGAKKSSALPQ